MKNTTSVTYESNESTYFVNNETGEVQNETHHQAKTVRHSREPSYIKLYLDHLARFKGVQISLNPILTECLKYITYASGEESNGGMLLILNKFLKDQIAKKCGVSLQRVNNAITEFVKKGYMRRIDLGSYQLNPFLFGKGEWKDIENVRATFDYGTGEVVAEIVKKEEEAINQATDEISKKSFEELTELQKKKRYEELDHIPLEFWTETDYAIANEKIEEFIYEDCTMKQEET